MTPDPSPFQSERFSPFVSNLNNELHLNEDEVIILTRSDVQTYEELFSLTMTFPSLGIITDFRMSKLSNAGAKGNPSFVSMANQINSANLVGQPPAYGAIHPDDDPVRAQTPVRAPARPGYVIPMPTSPVLSQSPLVQLGRNALPVMRSTVCKST